MRRDPVGRAEILQAIRALADKLKRCPTRSEFLAQTGITLYRYENHFPNWREAVRAVGLEPSTASQPIESETLLQDYGRVVRKLGHIPMVVEYEQHGRYHRNTLEKRYGCPFSKISAKFREYAEGRPEWADVIALPAADVGSQTIRTIEDEALLQDWGDVARRLGHIPKVSEYKDQGRFDPTTIKKRFGCPFSRIPAKFREYAEGRPQWADVLALPAADVGSRTIEDEALLRDWGEIVRNLRHIPTVAQYRRQGRFSRRTMEARFGPWSKIPATFREFAKGRPEWADVVALLPVVVPDRRQTASPRTDFSPIANSFRRHSKLSDRPTYGNPIDFRGLRHEPVNEQGVVFLFGMVARELGYLVEAVQAGFPDCEAKRQILRGKWQRVRIEFEYESRNFCEHEHPPDGCDVIVCWRHNWPECPPHLEIVELQQVIKSLAKSEDDDV